MQTSRALTCAVPYQARRCLAVLRPQGHYLAKGAGGNLAPATAPVCAGLRVSAPTLRGTLGLARMYIGILSIFKWARLRPCFRSRHWGEIAVKFQAPVHSRPKRHGNCANKTNHNFSERSHNVCLVRLGPLTTRSISLTPLRNFQDHQAPGRQTRGRRGTRERQSGFAKSICIFVIVVMPTE